MGMPGPKSRMGAELQLERRVRQATCAIERTIE